MFLKNTTTYGVAFVTGIALLAFFYVLQQSFWGSVTNPFPEAYYAAPVERASGTAMDERDFAVPAKLLIPSIGVTAKVQHVGTTAAGAMGIPSNFVDVAWYKHGPIPGKVGSAVIDGHVDNALGLAGVFKRLHEVQEGEEVAVIDKNGAEARFKIINIQTYPYEDAPAEEIFGPTDKRLLRLITCGGKWIPSAKTYETRLVVTTEYIL